jgi:hypothetical protein
VRPITINAVTLAHQPLDQIVGMDEDSSCAHGSIRGGTALGWSNVSAACCEWQRLRKSGAPRNAIDSSRGACWNVTKPLSVRTSGLLVAEVTCVRSTPRCIGRPTRGWRRPHARISWSRVCPSPTPPSSSSCSSPPPLLPGHESPTHTTSPRTFPLEPSPLGCHSRLPAFSCL